MGYEKILENFFMVFLKSPGEVLDFFFSNRVGTLVTVSCFKFFVDCCV